MALFQEKQTENFEEFNTVSPISRDYANEFKSIYNERIEYAEKTKQEESLYLQNLISKDKINEWQSKGGLTAIEVWNKKNKHELLPYAGTISQGKQTFKIKSISDKLRNGQRISAEERQQFDDFLLDMAEIQARGYTFGGGAVNIGLETLPFVAEFGVGLLTSGGIGSLGSATAKTGAKATLQGMKNNIAKTLAEKTGKEIAGDIVKGAGKVAYNTTLNPRTYAFSMTRLPQQVYARMGDVMLSDSLAISEEGQVILKEAEAKPATAFMKALALTNIEVASEASGDILVRPFLHGMERVVGLKALKQLAKTKLPENFVKLAEEVTNLPFLKAVDQLGFNGILEEIGEERVADLLKFSFNLDDKEGYSFEQFLDSAFVSPAELAQEAVAFGVIGAGANVVNKGLQKVSEKYTKDGFLVDAGIFRVAGQDSLLDAKVKETLKQQGVSDEDIENVIQFASRDDKAEFLKHGNLNQEVINERAEKVSEIKNKYYTQNLNAGIEDTEALQNAELISQVIATSANNFGMTIEEADEAFGLNIQSMTEEEAKAHLEELKNPKVKFQTKENVTKTEAFKKWFGNSKIVDEKGEPLVVYHGTPNAGFEVFKDNSHFTSDKNYANIYQNQGASSISYKKTADNPDTYAVYLSIQKPFDTRDKEARNIFLNEYRAYYSPELTDKGMVDWLEVEELTEWLKENHPEYDGIIADEGGVGGYGLEVINRGVSYIPFSPEQIKSVENKGTFDKKNPNIYFESDLSTAFRMVQDIFSKKGTVTAQQIFDKKPILQPLAVYFQDVLKNTRVKAMPKWMSKGNKLLGSHLFFNNTIFLNMERINKYPNADQTFIRVFLHELVHAKQNQLLDYAKKNKNNKNLSEQERKDLKTYIKACRKSEKEEHLIDRFRNKHSAEEIKNNPELEKEASLLYSRYENAYLEIDADNVALALQSYIGNADSEILQSYLGVLLESETLPQNAGNNRHIKAIRAFIARRKGKSRNLRLSHEVNTRVHYQSDEDLFEDEDLDNKRAFTHERTNFDGTAKDNLVVLLKGKTNKATILHEFAHVYLTTLNNLARTNDKAKEMLIKVNKFLRYNGKEYTTAQHEKFANYFVAYVRTGQAPNYGLKKVFENFKKWLNDLYTNLQLTGEVELSKEAVDLFDELLGNMTLKAQKEISEDIIKKAKNNALLKYQEDNIEKHNIPANQLTERQRRYRDTAYDILWYAISHSKSGKEFVKDKKQLYMLLGNDHKAKKNNMGVMKQSERLFELLSELDDEFSANDGFLPEWGEFFYDPNVSEGYDAELALQALDVIQNKKYLYDTENLYQELSDEDVKIAELELDYILEEYSNETGDKSNIVCAFFDWVESKHPYIQEDLINRWELRTNEIDRYQSLSKFQQAKEDLKIIASKMQGHGDYSMQFAQYAREILKRLDFMTERDKEKIFGKLKEYNSFREIERNLDYVMDYAETLQEVTDRKNIADDIVKEVKQTIHEWKDGIKRTKYTYPANKLFERLREINRMKLEEVEALYDELVNEETSPSYVADEVNNETFYETIERMFVTFRHNGNYYNSTEFLTDLLEKIQTAKFTAKVARDEKDFELQMQKINLIDECARAVDEHKSDKKGKLVELAEKANAHVMNFNGALKMIFNEAIKNKFSLDYLYAKKDGLVGRDRREVLDKLKDVFQFKNDAQLFSRFIDMTKAEYEIRQRFTPDIETGSIHTSDIFDKESGQTKATVQQILPEGTIRSEWEAEPVKLSKMEILYYYIQAKNKISYQMLTDMGDETRPPKGQFDKFEFDQMIDSLTPEEKLMGDILQISAEKYYDGLNAYHIKKYHTDLGKVSCYFPRLSETEDPRMLDVFNDYVSLNSKDSSQKHRTAYIGTRIKPANAVAVLFQHIEKANTIIVMGEQLDLMNRVFNNSNLKHKIENQFGQDITQAFYQHVTANLYGGQTALRSLQEQFFAKLANNVIKTQIFAKPQVGLKQLLSFMNYGKGDEYVSASEWLKEFTKQALTPAQWKKNIEFMLENEYLRDRFTRGGSMDALKRQLENRIFSKLSLLDDIWGLPIKLGDIGAIIWGGKPYIDVLMKKGYTKEQAFRIFIETTVNDQQSSIPSTLSNAQRNAKSNPFSTMMFAYQNTPYQYLRSAYTPIVTALQKGGKENIAKAGKMFFIYGWLFPAIFNVASSLSIFTLLGGDDDQFKKDMMYAFLGLFGMLPITGDFISAIIYGLTGDNYSGGTDYFATASRKLNKLARHIQSDKVTSKDMWDSIVIFTETFTGQPTGAVGNSLSGAYDVTQGKVAKGSMKLLGFSDYRAKVVTGEKD